MGKQPPKCKYCDLTLKWPPWTGKPQRPVEKSGNPHNCPKFKGSGNSNYSTKTKWVKLTKEDYNKCELCPPELGWCLTPETKKKYEQLVCNTLDEHLKLWHPNKERLDAVDFMAITDENKQKIRELRKRTIKK